MMTAEDTTRAIGLSAIACALPTIFTVIVGSGMILTGRGDEQAWPWLVWTVVFTVPLGLVLGVFWARRA